MISVFSNGTLHNKLLFSTMLLLGTFPFAGLPDLQKVVVIPYVTQGDGPVDVSSIRNG